MCIGVSKCVCVFHHCHDVLIKDSLLSCGATRKIFLFWLIVKLISNSLKLCMQDLMHDALKQYNTTDEAMICEQIDLPMNITQKPVWFSKKYKHAISFRPLEGAHNEAISQCFSIRLSTQHSDEQEWHYLYYGWGSAKLFCVQVKCAQSGISFKHVLNVTEMRCLIELLSARPRRVIESRRVDSQRPLSCISIASHVNANSFFLLNILMIALQVNTMQRTLNKKSRIRWLHPVFMDRWEGRQRIISVSDK